MKLGELVRKVWAEANKRQSVADIPRMFMLVKWVNGTSDPLAQMASDIDRVTQ